MDLELYDLWVELIERTDILQDRIINFLNGNYDTEVAIREEYIELKKILRETSKRLKRREYDSKEYLNDNMFMTFRSNVGEAAAFGFTERTNAIISKKMYSAVEEANYKLKKMITYNEDPNASYRIEL